MSTLEDIFDLVEFLSICLAVTFCTAWTDEMILSNMYVLRTLRPALWILNGLVISRTLRRTTEKRRRRENVKRSADTTTSISRAPIVERKNNDAVDCSLPADGTPLKPFVATIDAPFSIVDERVEKNLVFLAGTDLRSMAEVESKSSITEREYVFTLDDVPSVIQSALGANEMRLRETCGRDETRRVSRFVNTSFTNMLRVVVIETYRPHPAHPKTRTEFEVKCSMYLGLPWPVKSIATSFALSDYEPKLKEKLERILSLVVQSKEKNNDADAKGEGDAK
eukprot:g529.t1